MTNQQNCQEYSSNTSVNSSGSCSNSHPTLTQIAKFNSNKAPCNHLPQLFPVVKNDIVLILIFIVLCPRSMK